MVSDTRKIIINIIFICLNDHVYTIENAYMRSGNSINHHTIFKCLKYA